MKMKEYSFKSATEAFKEIYDDKFWIRFDNDMKDERLYGKEKLEEVKKSRLYKLGFK